MQKLTCNISNADLVNLTAYANFGLIPSILSQDIEQKQSRNNGNDRQTVNSIPPAPQSPTYCRHARETTLLFFVMNLSPPKLKS